MIQGLRQTQDFGLKDVGIRRLNPQPPGSKHQALKMPSPLTGLSGVNADGLEETITILKSPIDDLDQILIPAINHNPQWLDADCGRIQSRIHHLRFFNGTVEKSNQSRRKISVPLVPPKPKELESATSIFISRAVLGT